MDLFCLPRGLWTDGGAAQPQHIRIHDILSVIIPLCDYMTQINLITRPQ